MFTKKQIFLSLYCFLCSLICFAQQDDLGPILNKYDTFKLAVKNKDQEAIILATKDLRSSYDLLQKTKQEEVKKALLDELISVFEGQDNNSFLKIAQRALDILPQDDSSRFDILNIMADIYAQQGNRELLVATINQMKNAAGSSSVENSAVLAELQQKTNALNRFPADLDGVWVSDVWMNDKDQMGRPFLVLSINSTSNGKTAKISNLSAITSQALTRFGGLTIRSDKGFEFSVPSARFKFSFFSDWNHYGSASMANSLLDEAQETRANFHALALDRRATLGQTATAEFAGNLLAVGLEALASAASASSYSEENIFLSGLKADNNTLDVRLLHQGIKVGTYGYGSSKTIYDESFRLWRWNRADIVFGNPRDCQPISPFVSKLTEDMDLYAIKQETSFSKPKYFLPTLLGMGLGLVCIFHGFEKRPDASRKDIQYWYGLDKQEAKQAYKEMGYQKAAVSSALWVLSGAAITITVPIVEHRIRMKHRAQAVGEYNLLQYQTLYDLYDKE